MKNQEDIARLITLEAVSFKLNNFTAFHGINFSHSKAGRIWTHRTDRSVA